MLCQSFSTRSAFVCSQRQAGSEREGVFADFNKCNNAVGSAVSIATSIAAMVLSVNEVGGHGGSVVVTQLLHHRYYGVR